MNGTLGEIKAAAYLIGEGYRVYHPLDGHDKFDLVAFKDNTFFRVQVKSCSFKKNGKDYTVTLDTTIKLASGNKRSTISNEDCDILLVYLVPDDEIVQVENFENKSKIRIKRD